MRKASATSREDKPFCGAIYTPYSGVEPFQWNTSIRLNLRRDQDMVRQYQGRTTISSRYKSWHPIVYVSPGLVIPADSYNSQSSLPCPYSTSHTPPTGTSITASVPSLQISFQFTFRCCGPMIWYDVAPGFILEEPPGRRRPLPSITDTFATSSTMFSMLFMGRVKYPVL